MTGGGRCNVTNAEFDIRTLLKQYGDAEKFLHTTFAQFGVQNTFDFFTSQKLPLVVEDRKRTFPESQKAFDVTACMVSFMKQYGVTVRTSTKVLGFQTNHEGNVVGVKTQETIYHADAYILASGGISHADTGSTGEGISWLQSLGHHTYASNPNLVPLKVKDMWIKKLSGTTLSNVSITFTQGLSKLCKKGNILCTHFGLSGPLILNSSYEVREMLKGGAVSAFIDLFPRDDVGTLRTKLQMLFEEKKNKTLANVLRVSALLEVLPATLQTIKVHSITRETRHVLVERMKHMPLTVINTMGYDKAVISDGGVELKEIDTKTMQSRLHTNVYIIGDVLHVNRPSGGYSLQLCWTTGWVAGISVCQNSDDSRDGL
jgi:predicted Rossmann fold flavoprotein